MNEFTHSSGMTRLKMAQLNQDTNRSKERKRKKRGKSVKGKTAHPVCLFF